MDLTVQQLRMLREVATKGTIAAAAEALDYTPSAVSQQLSGLSRATGVEVLERIGRNVRLTDAGRELVRHAGALLQGLEAAQVAMEQVNNDVRGELTVTVYESVASTLVVPLLIRLATEHPDLTLRTRELDPGYAIDSLATGEIDLAFGIDYEHDPAAPRADIVRTTVFDDAFRLIVPVDDPIEGPTVTFAELSGRSFIASPAYLSCGGCVMSACRRHGLEPNVVHELDDFPTALRLVAAGQGIALIPDLGLLRLPDGVRVVDLAEPFSRKIQLLSRATNAERPAVRAVREALEAVVADQLPASSLAAA